jgi:hypothetical protein
MVHNSGIKDECSSGTHHESEKKGRNTTDEPAVSGGAPNDEYAVYLLFI